MCPAALMFVMSFSFVFNVFFFRCGFRFFSHFFHCWCAVHLFLMFFSFFSHVFLILFLIVFSFFSHCFSLFLIFFLIVVSFFLFGGFIELTGGESSYVRSITVRYA